MAIFRGDGGSGDSSTDAYASQIAVYAQTATTKANEASASASAAATSAVLIRMVTSFSLYTWGIYSLKNNPKSCI